MVLKSFLLLEVIIPPDNFEPTNIYIHFAFAGQIHEQIKDLPVGTKINKVTFKKK